MNNNQAIGLVLEKYRFALPLDPEGKRAADISKKKNLSKILRTHGKTGIFTAVAVWVLFRAKNAGYTLTLTKAYITAVALAAASACAVTAASAVAVVSYVRSSAPAVISAPPAQESAAPAVRSPQAVSRSAIQWKLELQPFSSAPEIKGTADLITAAVRTKLSTEMKIPVFTTGSVSADAPMILVGSIMKLDSNYILNARLVDTKTSKIVLLISEKGSEDRIRDIAAAAADKISRELR